MEARPDISCSFTPIVGFKANSKRTPELNQQFLFNEGVGFGQEEENETGVIKAAFYDNILGVTSPSPPFDYNWETGAERNWYAAAVMQQHEYDCSGEPLGIGAFTRAVTIYQLVAKCSYFTVRSGRFKRFETFEFLKNSTIVEVEIEYGS